MQGNAAGSAFTRQQLESSIGIDPDASILSNMTEMIRLRSDPFAPIYKLPGFPHAPHLPSCVPPLHRKWHISMGIFKCFDCVVCLVDEMPLKRFAEHQWAIQTFNFRSDCCFIMHRDRELARVRMTVRRNMESIDKQIKVSLKSTNFHSRRSSWFSDVQNFNELRNICFVFF